MSGEYKALYKSEIGPIEIIGTEAGITSINFVKDTPVYNSKIHPCLQECLTQIDEYFLEKRKTFTVKLQLSGTEFEKKVWQRLLEIPFGKTVSYKHIARLVGNEKAVRAVGNTNRKNKIAIIVPCHRVIGSNGKLVGYAGELWRKEWLLEHENNMFKTKAV